MEVILLLLLISVPVAAAVKGLGRRWTWFGTSALALVLAIGGHIISIRATLSTLEDLRRPISSSASLEHSAQQGREASASQIGAGEKRAAEDRATPSKLYSYSRLATRVFASMCLGLLFAGLFYRKEIGGPEGLAAVPSVTLPPSLPVPARAPEGLCITAREVQGITVLDLSGRLVLGEACNTLRGRWRQLLAANKTEILLNLRDVSRVDSAGIGSLVEAVIETTKHGGHLKVVHLSRLVQGVLAVHKLSPVFEVYDNEEKALTSFKS